MPATWGSWRGNKQWRLVSFLLHSSVALACRRLDIQPAECFLFSPFQVLCSLCIFTPFCVNHLGIQHDMFLQQECTIASKHWWTLVFQPWTIILRIGLPHAPKFRQCSGRPWNIPHLHQAIVCTYLLCTTKCIVNNALLLFLSSGHDSSRQGGMH